MSWGIDEDTLEIGQGPLNLDVAMARAHGWTEEQIARTWETLQALADLEGGAAQERCPHLYRVEGGETVFVGDDTTP